ncbi:hypothetical protein O181_073215 [Austropuccinia psidii MF-1]|uniref:Uncharacterized protein n=1 Tax=Austropuccinia psidii MF-1 TaxID=1389203 RepID=A0A9Q3IBS5_9BASI|nr:hypothetical protein [Austropuccinia psidii MF-1]
MRKEHGKDDWLWWKSERIDKWGKTICIFKMENAFESSIFNSDKDRPLTWVLKKDRSSALHPDMSESIIDSKILRKVWGELEHAIKCRFVEPCSTEVYNNVMKYIIISQGSWGKQKCPGTQESRAHLEGLKGIKK